MTFKLFDRAAPDKRASVETEYGLETDRGANYIADEELETAVNVAIALGRPLLVSGDPGCGKTELGFAVARKLGLERVYFYSTQSSAAARDVLYEYDAIGRFQSAQVAALEMRAPAVAPADAVLGARVDPRAFIRYAALGRAMLDAHGKQAIKDYVAGDYTPPDLGRQSVVIIDEIDKAPADFPNDLLEQIESFRFRVPEIGAVGMPVLAETVARPLVFITSNSEKQLPDAFLRRCVYCHIPFPSPQRLQEIVENWLARPRNSERFAQVPKGLVAFAAEFGAEFRKYDLQKKPGTAEFINFVTAATLIAASEALSGTFTREQFKTLAVRARYALVKLRADEPAFLEALRAF